MKTIYGEILKYASTVQKKLKLTEKQNHKITDIKIANRKMVEAVKDVKELNKNLNVALTSDNKYLLKEYNNFRKKVIKVIRIIYLFKTQENTKKYVHKLTQLKKEAKENKKLSNKSLDKLIRDNFITVEMASSLFNDYANVNDIIKKIIEVAELLYDEKDSLFE